MRASKTIVISPRYLDYWLKKNQIPGDSRHHIAVVSHGARKRMWTMCYQPGDKVVFLEWPRRPDEKDKIKEALNLFGLWVKERDQTSCWVVGREGPQLGKRRWHKGSQTRTHFNIWMISK